MKLAVTLTMPWPLPCRGSLPLRLALVLPPSQCRFSWRQALVVLATALAVVLSVELAAPRPCVRGGGRGAV